MRLRHDGSDVFRAPQGGGGPVDLRTRRGGGADEQRLGTRAAACRDLAEGQRWDGQCRWQPVRGADADGDCHLSAAEARRAGVSQCVLRGASARPEGPVPAAGKLTTLALPFLSARPRGFPLGFARNIQQETAVASTVWELFLFASPSVGRLFSTV